MSLNELFALLRSFVSAIPFTLFDYILVFAFIGYVVEEGSYNLGIVIKRSIALVLCGIIALVFYRFPSNLLQGVVFISKGIADGISLIGLWLFCIGVNGLISHFFVKDRGSSFSLSTKIKFPFTVLVSFGGFVALAGVIVHVFVSMPIPLQAKSFLTSSYFVQKMFIATFSADIYFQKIYDNDPSSVLHAQIIQENDPYYDLRSIGIHPKIDLNDTATIERLNKYRKSVRREEFIQEDILTSAAYDLAQKYSAEGGIGDQSSEVVGVLIEKGFIFSNARTVSIVADSPIFLPAYLTVSPGVKKIIQDREIARMGYASVFLSGSRSLSVFIFSD